MHRIIPPYLEVGKNLLLLTDDDIVMYLLMISLMTDLTNSRPIQMINNYYPDLRSWIINITPKLQDNELFSFDLATRCRWIMSGRSDFPICRFCGCQFGFTRNLPIRCDYSEWCSNKCRQTDPMIVARTKATKLKNHGDENYCNVEKITLTFYEHFGVSNPNKLRSVREKIELTCLENYGYTCVFKSPTIQEQIRLTNLKRRGVGSPLADPVVRAKGKMTSLDKYGTEYPMLSNVVKQRVKDGFISHYGVDNNMKSEEGFKYWQQRFNEKYGVDNPLKCPEIRDRMRRKYVYDNLLFDSSPELAFYIWLKDNHINFEYQPHVSFTYEHDGKQHEYFPDFRVNEQYVEIKGDLFFDDTGKMICPFRNNDMSNEEYALLNERFESKHQCMLKNNVKILRSKDYALYLNYVSKTYGKDYLQLFRVNKSS